jgi:hypothetical protein
MLHLGAVANPAIAVMVLVCILGAGFMIRFLIALTVDGRETRTAYGLRRDVHYAADMARAKVPYRNTGVNSAARLAIGAVRITSALAFQSGRKSRPTPVEGLHGVTLGPPRPELDFNSRRRYRSG